MRGATPGDFLSDRSRDLPANSIRKRKSPLKLSSLRLVVPLALLMAGAPLFTHSAAQVTGPVTPAPPDFETRRELEAQALSAEQAGKRSEAWLLRTRLQQGDFQEGDRIVVTIGNNPPRIDTMQVRSGRMLQFGIADIPLTGVLRSELTDTLRHHLAKYIVNPIVRATPLLPIAVFGPVGIPGYHYFAADVLLRDVLMRVGGIAGADVKKTTIRRGNEVIWTATDVRIALTDGLSLDRLHLRAGDEVVVPAPRRPRASLIIAALSTTATIALMFTRGGLF